MNLRNILKHRQGFTIVELLIVIVVIAILAAVTIVAYNGISKQAQVTAVNASAKQWIDLLELYKVQNDTYPGFGISSDPTVSGCLADPSDLRAEGVFEEGQCYSGVSGGIAIPAPNASATATLAALRTVGGSLPAGTYKTAGGAYHFSSRGFLYSWIAMGSQFRLRWVLPGEASCNGLATYEDYDSTRKVTYCTRIPTL